MQAPLHPSENPPALTTSGEVASPAAPKPQGRGGGAGALVVVGILLALGVPVGMKIRGAVAARKAMEAERARTAQAAEAKGSLAKEVTTVRPRPRAWMPIVPFDGTLMAVQEVDLAFRAPGTIAKVNAKVGDTVAKNALLAALDISDLAASRNVASAQVKAAEVQLSLAHENDDLTTALIQSGAAPGTSEVQTKGNVGLALANLEASRAQVASIGVAMKNSQIYAPFAGTITSAPTAAGGMAAPGVPLFHLVDVSALRLVGTVSEQDAELVKVDAPVTIDGKAIAPAKVKSVLPTLDAATRRVPVEAIVPNEGASPLLAGSFVRASIASGTKLDVLVVPATVLRAGTQDEVVVAVQGKAVLKKIAFTRDTNGDLLVRSGLSERDDVVDAPSPDLQDGSHVDVKVK